jgi:Peptidoglycan-synthase activator LpoB
MKTTPWTSTLLVSLVCGLALSCSGALQPTEFLNPNFDFSFVERVAVLPFQNHTDDRQAGSRATRLAITELLASGTVDVVEPGEVQAALTKLTGAVPGRSQEPSTEQVVALAKALGVQAVILGAVTQSEIMRSGGQAIPAVTLDLHMVETETGATVWAATNSEKGTSFGSRVLGTAGQPIAETTRRCLRNMMGALIQ